MKLLTSIELLKEDNMESNNRVWCAFDVIDDFVLLKIIDFMSASTVLAFGTVMDIYQ